MSYDFDYIISLALLYDTCDCNSANGYLRMFARLRRNTNCKMRGNSCDLFGNMKPAPIPEDIYPTIGYQNDLNWMILSNKDTGSDLHNDPDVMGAWNYLINGKKHWVVFPKGEFCGLTRYSWITFESFRGRCGFRTVVRSQVF